MGAYRAVGIINLEYQRVHRERDQVQSHFFHHYVFQMSLFLFVSYSTSVNFRERPSRMRGKIYINHNFLYVLEQLIKYHTSD